MPVLSRRCRGSAASTTAQSPVSSADRTVSDSALIVADPAGRSSAQTDPPDSTENQRCGPGAPQRVQSSKLAA